MLFFREMQLFIKPHLCNTCSRIVRRMAGSRLDPVQPSRRSCYLTYFQSTISGGWWLSARCRSLSWLATSRRRGNTSAKSTGQIQQVNTSINVLLTLETTLDCFASPEIPQNCIILQNCCFSSCIISHYIWDYISQGKE